MDDALHDDDDADDLVEVDVVVERQIRRQLQRSHQCQAVSVKSQQRVNDDYHDDGRLRALCGTRDFHKRAPLLSACSP